jgi:hypothetical protein
MPVISIKMDNRMYKLNSQFAEVKRIDSIINEFVDREAAKELYLTIHHNLKAIEQLYNIDYSKIPVLPKEALPYSGVGLRNPFNLLPIRYITHGLVPELVLGLSFFSFIISTFLMIVLYNLRKIFYSYTENNTFSQENSARLQYIGVYFLIGEFVRVLIFYWINNSVARTEWMNAVRQSYKFSFTDINFALLFAGTIFLILAQIFRMGNALKEENDLTV